MMENVENENSKVCCLCLKEPSRYTCPRCNIRYCSADCYKCSGHMGCSEAFYKDCFMEGLKDHKISNEERRNVMGMLQNLEQERQLTGSDDEHYEDEEDTDLEDRLKGLDLDKDIEAVWTRLTPKEKKEFQQMSSDGRLSQLLDVWCPWWEVKDTRLVREEGEDDDVKPSGVVFPVMHPNIPDLISLTGKNKPSADIKLHVLSLMYSYCFVCRLYNGDLKIDPCAAVQDLLLLSDTLNKDVQLISSHDALHKCLHRLSLRVIDCDSSVSHATSLILDVIKVILGPEINRPLDYLLLALSDIYWLAVQAKKLTSKAKKKLKEDNDSDSMKKKLFLFTKKLEYLMSWTQKLGMSMHALVPELRLEYEAIVCENEVHHIKEENMKKVIQEQRKTTKPLIQEL